MIKNEPVTPLGFFESVFDAYQQAETASGRRVDRFYRIADFVVRLRFAGPVLLSPVTRALSHLATGPVCNPALTVCLWDSASTGTLMPSPPWQVDDFRERGEIRGFNDGRIYTFFLMGPNSLSLVDMDRDLAVFWVKEARQIPNHDTCEPLRTIFNLWLGRHGVQLVHAGAVGRPSGGVLIVGKSGVGKSTTALACLDSELSYASDDHCLLTGDSTPTVYSLYNTAKLNADSAARLPFLASRMGPPDRNPWGKGLYFLHEHFPEKLLLHFPLRAILIPRIDDQEETSLTRASPAAAMMATAPNTIFQLPGAGKEAFHIMAKAIQHVPCYHLNLGADVAQIPKVILDLLRHK
jgi:hypothetical protein